MDSKNINDQEVIDIPLFRLGSTLHPFRVRTLKLVRYLDMIKHCFKKRKPFGVVTFSDGLKCGGYFGIKKYIYWRWMIRGFDSILQSRLQNQVF